MPALLVSYAVINHAVAVLVAFFADFLAGALLRQSLLHPFSLTWLQVVGVTLYFLNDVFGLNLALEAAQGVFQGLALLQSNFCHRHHPPTSILTS